MSVKCQHRDPKSLQTSRTWPAKLPSFFFFDPVKTSRLDDQGRKKVRPCQTVNCSVVVSPHVRYKLDDCTSRSSNVVVDPRMTALYAQSSRLVGIDGPEEEIINLLTK